MAVPRVTVGWVGLGSMGSGMAKNMVSRFGLTGPLLGHAALLHDVCAPTADKALALCAEAIRPRLPVPAQVTNSLDEIGRQCSVVVLCLPDSQAVWSCVQTLAPLLPVGALMIDTSTTGPATAKQAALLLRQHGAAFLDAPVTGAPARAAAGTLTVMAGGDETHLRFARPLLETFASKVLYMGATGNGQIAKAFNNCLYNVSCAATAEMLPLALRAGLPLEAFVEAVSTGTGQSFGFQQWAPRILQREFAAPKYGFPMESAFKDLETLAAVAKELGLETPPVVAAARQTYERALASGLGHEHKGAMVKVWEEQLQVTCTAADVVAGSGGDRST
ncbi:unnamed protein product [Polarella glacialis]|uniref:3-hydroxyisobutyrate dehydrogenase n=1 Tax=Polarella glacialis TaxID=89957 RepID=A0A813LNI9_POLGL|nr:unnamed protein product [Polarella glacialis]